MANAFVKAEKVVNAALGLLESEVVASRLVWRDGVGDFAGAKDDTINVRLPAYVDAKTRALRSGATRTKSSLQQRKIAVTLDTDVYLDVPVTDEQMELDIVNFSGEIIQPMMAGTARTIEQRVIAEMQGATYAHEFEIDYSDLGEVFAEGRRLLNMANVPMGERTAAVGSNVDKELIQLPQFIKANESGSTDTLREAIVGRYYGFTVVAMADLDPDEIVFMHKTAFALVTRAPKVPAGAPWGATGNYGGFATRVVRVFDPDEVEDRVVSDSWIGTGVVTDQGDLDATTGRFTPAEDLTGADTVFVRAVHIVPATP